MEPTLITPPSTSVQVQQPLVMETSIEEKKIVYPWARHVLLVILVILAIVIIFSLIYLNGKSIYQYGL